jgi:TetR/AcrR family transcriptional repressor of lmrAB and yxaGH operons
MSPKSDTRQRLLDASASLFRRQGYAASGLKQIVTEGEAPWGSVYHFFPNGKEQLAVEAILRSGARYEKLIDRAFERAGNPVDGTLAFFAFAAEALDRSDHADGCPIATVALEAGITSEPLREACATVFSSWTESIGAHYAAAGISSPDALARFALSALEGAILLSRTLRDTAALAQTGHHVAIAIRAAQ